MIGRLRGVLAEAGEDEVLIEVGGVGYVLRCGSKTLSRLPPIGDEVLLHVESQWSQEQGPRLYGFLGRDERRAFVALLSVQGVGPKAALSVLDVLGPGELAQAVAREDKASVGRANGVGPKLALRIVTELKDKQLADVGAFHVSALAPIQAAAPQVSTSGEAVSALMGLGIAEAIARRTVDQALIRLGEDAEVSAVIRAALQDIGR
ncbi:MAG: Holliday junction branch migration protein RuvA [Proteobacteria bacterium]|nr:Holliday junction branch migration protein RuvA [Pseudomonadota bacterium]